MINPMLGALLPSREEEAKTFTSLFGTETCSAHATVPIPEADADIVQDLQPAGVTASSSRAEVMEINERGDQKSGEVNNSNDATARAVCERGVLLLTHLSR